MVLDRANALRRRVLGLPRRPRRFLRKGVTVEAFLTELTRHRVNYAVLRWFESLPDVDPGEDLDLLVSDEDLCLLEGMLSESRLFPATQAVDLYSVSGIRGTDYNGVPYFPRTLALEILQNSILLRGKFRVPAPLDHFRSLAFHAVYHKGETAGIPLSSREMATVRNPDHDYLAVLERLSSQVGEGPEITLDGLDSYLERTGLRPPSDLLERYQTRNSWLRRKLAKERPDIGPVAGLISFVIRDRAMAFADEAVSIIERDGFEVLKIIHLSEEERSRVSRGVRGGNWSCGPFPLSGGGPAAIIVAYDFSYRPVACSDGQMINGNAAATKACIRDLIYSRIPKNQHFNPLHATDNGWQSLECLRAAGREGLIADVENQIADLERSLQVPWPVIRELSVSGRRARVLIVDHPEHGETVAKVFRRSARRFFERELAARKDLAGLPCVPELLEHGENWILTPLYSDNSTRVFRRLPGSREAQLTFDAMASLAALLRSLRDRKYFVLDFSAHNLILDPQAGLKMIDFEFMQRYAVPIPPLNRDFTVLGKASQPGVDAPVYRGPPPRFASVHRSVFHPAVCGLSPNEFFLRPNFSRRARMAILQAVWWTAFAVKGPLKRAIDHRLVRRSLRLLSGVVNSKLSSRLYGDSGRRAIPQAVGRSCAHPRPTEPRTLAR